MQSSLSSSVLFTVIRRFDVRKKRTKLPELGVGGFHPKCKTFLSSLSPLKIVWSIPNLCQGFLAGVKASLIKYLTYFSCKQVERKWSKCVLHYCATPPHSLPWTLVDWSKQNRHKPVTLTFAEKTAQGTDSHFALQSKSPCHRSQNYFFF